MPITKSAKKALRQNKRRREINLRRINELKKTVKKFKKLITENKKEEALKLLPKTYKAIDKAAKGGVIKKNTADRKKSRLTKMLNKKEAKVSPQTVPAQQ
jgi:small subunit ribosomal protein S20